MNHFAKCNHVSGSYTSEDDIKNFKFKVKLRELNETIPIIKIVLPTNNKKDQIEPENVGNFEERSFDWQQKVSKVTNDSSEKNEKNETDSVNDDTVKKQILISYVDEDDYDNRERLTTDSAENVSKQLNKLSIQEKTEDSLKNSKMFIVADMNDYTRQPVGLTSRERLLFTITWYPEEKRLTVSPDFNSINTNPYLLEINYDSKRFFHYSIERLIEDVDEAKLIETDVKKRISQYENDIRLRKLRLEFPVPLESQRKSLIIIEILSACQFEYDNLYVEYSIDLPYGYNCADNLKGTTQIVKTKKPNKTANFSHLFEINIFSDTSDAARESIVDLPRIHFEIVSCDFWNRRRTEGFCSTPLPIMRPGKSTVELNAIRPHTSEAKRFFVGGRVANLGPGESSGRLSVVATVVSQSSTLSGGDSPTSEGALDRYAAAKRALDACFESGGGAPGPAVDGAR